jgi:hypothetical protein
LQRLTGIYIEKRLKKIAKIDLRDQSKNQRLARKALDLGLATVDLSSASDTISRSLVISLLPFGWWELLDDLRSKVIFIPKEYLVEVAPSKETRRFGCLVTPEMFSSMGNGFTFQLETLIFWALTRAVRDLSGKKGIISVYGDDIICPTSIAPRLKRVFHFFGFTVNEKKSNWTGVFRESCGKHYYDGGDVSPFYIRTPVTHKTCVIRLLNRLLQWDSVGLGCLFTPSVAKFWLKWARVIPMHLHGGTDPESVTSLVTGDSPRSMLVPREARKGPKGKLAYDWWLTATSHRDSSGWCQNGFIPNLPIIKELLDEHGWGILYSPIVSERPILDDPSKEKDQKDEVDFTVTRHSWCQSFGKGIAVGRSERAVTWDPLELFPDLATVTPVELVTPKVSGR